MDEDGEHQETATESSVVPAAVAAFARGDAGAAFGPTFFLIQLGRFVRDRCPEPDEGLPVVALHLATGEVLDVCHIIGVASKWIVVAVREGEAMATDILPYELIRRVRIRATGMLGTSIGFDTGHTPSVVRTEAAWMSAERVLEAAMDPELVAAARDRRSG